MAYKHRQCDCCGQTITYDVTIGKGSFDTLKTLARAIGYKGINMIHPSKELLGNGLTNYQIGNLSILRFHGLIAKIKDNPGNYGLTRKGMDFLDGKIEIRETAIVMKAAHSIPAHTIGYAGADISVDYLSSGWCEYWRSNSFRIRNGRVMHEKSVLKKEKKDNSMKLI